MNLYVLRHAIAEDAAPGQPDSTRQLTKTGRKRCRRVLSHAHKVGVRPRVILTSPYARALQTAAIAWKELGVEERPITERALIPYVNVQDLWSSLRDRAAAGDLMVVGHNPQLSMLVAWLLGASADALWLKKSGLVAMNVPFPGPHPHATLSWLLTARSVGR